MSQFLPAISNGLAAFSATNIDDIIILSLFFSQVNSFFRRRHIVTGQYLGFGTLVAASLPGFFGGLIIPEAYIGMLGVVPIAIGINRWLNRDTEDSEESEESIGSEPSSNSLLSNFLSPQTCGVAAITVANGSDNISIYVPLFASSSWESLVVILGVFFSMVGVWCYAAYNLTRLPAIANLLSRYGNVLVPYVLIALGISILIESKTLSTIPLMIITLTAGCFFLLFLNRNNKQPEVENY